VDALERLTENVLLDIAGAASLQKAARAVQAGHVTGRMRYADHITANVLDRGEVYGADVAMHDDTIRFRCGCAQQRGLCLHVLAALIAFVRAPGTFAPAASEPGAAQAANRLLESFLAHLERFNVQELRAIAAWQGIRLSGTAKAPIVQTIAARLMEQETLNATWQRLSPAARLAAGVLVLAPEPQQIEFDEVTGALLQIDPRLDAEQALHDLHVTGYVYSQGRALAFVPALARSLPPDEDFVPGARGSAFTPHAVEDPLAFVLQATHVLLAVQNGGGAFHARAARQPHPVVRSVPTLSSWPCLAAELDELARLVQQGRGYSLQFMTLAPEDPLLADDTRRALAAAAGTDEPRVELLVRLLGALGVLAAYPGQALAVQAAPGHAFLQADLARRAKLLCDAWSTLATWSEWDLVAGRVAAGAPALQFAPFQSYNFGYAQVLQGLAHARFMLLAYLRRAPAGRWHDWAASMARAHQIWKDDAVWPPFGTRAAFGPPRVGAQPHKVDRAAHFRVFAEAVVRGPLAWQGVVEYALDEGRLVAFRVTPLGAALLHNAPPPDEAPAPGRPVLRFTADGALLLDLVRAAGDVVTIVTQLGPAEPHAPGAFVYRPAAPGAVQLFEAGWDAGGILAVLAEAAGGAPVPHALSTALHDWWARFGELQVYPEVALVELGDDYALPELLAGTSLARYLLARISPRLIAVRPDSVDAWRDELAAKGYTPKVL
jgi:hypothetical protein